MGKSYQESFRGIVAELNGKVIGVAGVLHTSQLQAFCTMDDTMKQYPKIVVKAIRAFKRIMKSYDVPIYAIASKTEESASGFLEHIGFKHYQNEVYVWQQQPSHG